MTTYSYSQLVTLATANGFVGGSAYLVAAIAMAESGGNTNAQNRNTDGSLDRGVLQINDVYHPEVNDACAYDAACSMRQAFRISSNGSNFTQWAAFNNKSYLQYIGGTYVGNTASTSGDSTTSLASSVSTPSLDPAWLANPMRLVKLLVGVGLVFLAVLFLVAPDIIDKGVKYLGKQKTVPHKVDKKRDVKE